jgi:hypothetical protein
MYIYVFEIRHCFEAVVIFVVDLTTVVVEITFHTTVPATARTINRMAIQTNRATIQINRTTI